MNLFRWLMERINDAIRERRIRRLRHFLTTCHPSLRHDTWVRMKAEIMARSPAQVERMTRHRGLV